MIEIKYNGFFFFRRVLVRVVVVSVHRKSIDANPWALLQDTGPVAIPQRVCRVPVTVGCQLTCILRDIAVLWHRYHRLVSKSSAVLREDTPGERQRHPLTRGGPRLQLPHHVRHGPQCHLPQHTCTLRRPPPKLRKAHQRERDPKWPSKVWWLSQGNNRKVANWRMMQIFEKEKIYIDSDGEFKVKENDHNFQNVQWRAVVYPTCVQT